MKLLSYKYDTMKKYIIYSDDDRGRIIHYVYKIFFHPESTELIKYTLSNIEHTFNIQSILHLDIKNPQESINKFYKILILQT
jgi:hypothetical protein